MRRKCLACQFLNSRMEWTLHPSHTSFSAIERLIEQLISIIETPARVLDFPWCDKHKNTEEIVNIIDKAAEFVKKHKTGVLLPVVRR